METSITPQTQVFKTNNEDLNEIALRISIALEPEKIICYSSTISKTEVISCFIEEQDIRSPIEKSHYGLLIIPRHGDTRTNARIQQIIEQFFDDGLVTTIVHHMEEVNQALQNGSSFFTGLHQHGQLLYDKGQSLFTETVVIKPNETRVAKREQFWDRWRDLAKGFIDGAHFYLTTQHNAMALYMLHQSSQHILSGVLRVLSGYRSNGDSLQHLCRLVETVLPQSPFVLPKGSPRQHRLMGLLLKGALYVRYNERSEANTDDVMELIIHTEKWLEMANTLCHEKLECLRATCSASQTT